jgi:LPXTG-motif cell wall-anchored protein
LLTLTGAAVGLVGATVLSLPAHASSPAQGGDNDRHHKATLAATTDCGQDGQYRINWTVTNKGDGTPETDTMEVTNSRPDGVVDSVTGKPIEGQRVAAGATATFVQLVPGTTKETVSFWFAPQWVHDPLGAPTPNALSFEVVLKGDCKPTPSHAPSGSPSASASGSASGSATAPALPKTGASSGLYGLGAVVLLCAGTGLFLAARRRRLRFEA